MAIMMSVAQAAERLGLSDAVVRRLCESGKLAADNIGQRGRAFWRITEQSVRDYKNGLRGRQQASAVNGNGNGIPDGFVTAKDAARVAGMTDQGIRWRAKRGLIESVNIGGRIYVKTSGLAPKMSYAEASMKGHESMRRKKFGNNGNAEQAAPAQPFGPAQISQRLDEITREVRGLATAVDLLCKAWGVTPNGN